MAEKTEIEYSIDRAMDMLNRRQDSELNDFYVAMDNMFRSYWQLPKDLVSDDINWIHRVTSTDPHDAVRAGARTLTAVMPKVTLHPLLNNEESKETTNQVEKALEWIFMLASRRRSTSVLRDVVLSALLYDEVIIGTWYLPYQEEIMREAGKDTRRLKAARRYGDFLINVYNPQDTIVEYSDLMAERVLIKRVVTAQEAIDYWNVQDDKLSAYSRDVHKYVTIYDYHEIGWRSVFMYLQEDSDDYTQIKREGAIEIVNDETPYDFLPIAAKIGGTSLTQVERYKRTPLLWSLHNSGQWETQNILETLLASEGLAYSVSPRYAVENEFDTDIPEMDFREPARIVNLRRGQRLQDLRPPQLNQGLELLADRIGQRMDKSTVPRVLRSGYYPAGAAFSSLNLATQSGMKSLTPYKELAEQALVDMFVNILSWIHFTNDEVEVYLPETAVVNEPQFGVPQQIETGGIITLDNSFFDIERVYLEVDLTEDVPTDYVAKINAAAMLVERLQGSYQKALEFAGETDPQGTIKLREAENIKLAENQARQTEIMNESNLNFMDMQRQLQERLQQAEQLLAQLQQAAQQAQQGQGAQPGAPGGGGGPGGMQPPQPGGAIPGAREQQMLAMQRARGNPNEGVFPESNPAEGDISPVQAAPGVGLREETQQNTGEA